MSPEREQAELLLRKANEDRAAFAKLRPDDEIADAVVGFHAQQAVEKALKSVLATAGDDYPRTHDLQLLLTRAGVQGVEVPEAVNEARRLAPWAVEFRYGETINEQLDREAAAKLVDEVLDWAQSQLDS